MKYSLPFLCRSTAILFLLLAPAWGIVRAAEPPTADPKAAEAPKERRRLPGDGRAAQGRCGQGPALRRRRPSRPGRGQRRVVSEDGLVMTAGHVVGKPGQQVIFIFADGKTAKGTTLGMYGTADAGLDEDHRPGQVAVRRAGQVGRHQAGHVVRRDGASAGLPAGAPARGPRRPHPARQRRRDSDRLPVGRRRLGRAAVRSRRPGDRHQQPHRPARPT